MRFEDEQALDERTSQAAFRQVFGKVGADNARRVLNILLESPFFYRDDDIDLFGVLRRRASTFRHFLQDFFGWDLYVDAYVARVVKPHTVNPVLRPSQRHIFRLRGRNEYVLFVLLLEYYQRQADEQNLDLDRCEEVRFVLSDYIRFVFQRYREELGEAAPSEEKILDWARALFDKLERFRFIAVRQKEGIVQEEGLKAGFTRVGTESLLYAMLPGLRCYRPEVLAREDMIRVASGAKADEDEDENGGGEEAEAMDREQERSGLPPVEQTKEEQQR